ncbi:MAG: hypothetical protein KF690_10610 [Bacteroidetes bacterium]|nr:hypothetical protein [Bacteroidota bacterium]
MPKTYLDKPYATVQLDESIPAVVVTHHGYQTSAEFRMTIEQAIRCVEENTDRYPNLGWLADTRKQNALDPEDIAWCNTEILRRCPQLRKLALVIPEDAFGAMAIEDFAGRSQQSAQLATRVFPSRDAALAWIWKS